jgi:2-amino-4-hydroxy-6-hydroxymethyldihydropteridine diphosphokinase
MHSAYLSLGSNIEPKKNLHSAWTSLNLSLQVIRSSSIWESPPYGAGGPNYLNALVEVSIFWDFEDLKWNVLRSLESRMGRIRTDDKFASRTIDLDVIIFDGEIIESNLWHLAYLAAPGAELLPDLKDPHTNLPLAQIAEKMAREQNTILRCRSFLELVENSAAD